MGPCQLQEPWTEVPLYVPAPSRSTSTPAAAHQTSSWLNRRHRFPDSASGLSKFCIAKPVTSNQRAAAVERRWSGGGVAVEWSTVQRSDLAECRRGPILQLTAKYRLCASRVTSPHSSGGLTQLMREFWIDKGVTLLPEVGRGPAPLIQLQEAQLRSGRRAGAHAWASMVSIQIPST